MRDHMGHLARPMDGPNSGSMGPRPEGAKADENDLHGLLKSNPTPDPNLNSAPEINVRTTSLYKIHNAHLVVSLFHSRVLFVGCLRLKRLFMRGHWTQNEPRRGSPLAGSGMLP